MLTTTPSPVQRARKAHPAELAQFHNRDYIEFLSRVSPSNQSDYQHQMRMHNFSEDCPVFAGMFDFCQLYAGASIDVSGDPDHHCVLARLCRARLCMR